ncbi:hypothetical protein LCGC14_1552050 [marine sediment metagenome]|uniref:Prohead serine protease domain-containing protein n=1 Tax=marine sediment metagenome TaxID=412755 RepID=A0A0F9L632_9ZZZZ
MERKTITSNAIKALDETGTGTVLIATLNVKDSDGDVTLPGAFGKQDATIVPAHDWSHVPLGKAKIREEGNDVLADFKLNLKIGAARDWHEALKHDMENPPAIQEWSYGFGIEKASFGDFDGHEVRFLEALKVREISPVIAGAGVDTRTIAIKGADGPESLKLADHIAQAMKAVEDVAERCKKIQKVREEDGRDLSPDRYAELEGMEKALEGIDTAAKALAELLKRGPEIDGHEADLLLAEFTHLLVPGR